MMVSAAAMAFGRLLGMPTYLAPRYVAVTVVAASAVVVYFVARRATASTWAGLAAGLALASFEPLARTSVSTLEPKHLVVLFAVVASLAIQRHRWIWAGVAAGCATACWQPAGLIPIALAPSVLTGERDRRWHRIGRFAAGAVAGALPALIYLGAHDAMRAFLERAIFVPLHSDLAEPAAYPCDGSPSRGSSFLENVCTSSRQRSDSAPSP